MPGRKEPGTPASKAGATGLEARVDNPGNSFNRMRVGPYGVGPVPRGGPRLKRTGGS